jgi:hypothetical protein
MTLLSAYFPTTPERDEELKLCIRHNLEQPFFSAVVLVCEAGADSRLDHPKLRCVNVSQRPDYRVFFALGNQCQPGEIVVVSNTDIMYDETLKCLLRLPAEHWEGTLFAVTRTNEDGKLQNPGSMDTWVYRAPLPEFDGWNLIPGIIGCDSFLAQKAMEAGLRVYNPALSIRCHHRHRVGARKDWLVVDGQGTCYWHAPGYAAVEIPYCELP